MKGDTMPKIEVNDEQIAARRVALAKLISGLERLDRVERNRGKIELICRERGMDFSRLTEEEREALVDEVLHESR
jgi:hypothetical protein